MLDGNWIRPATEIDPNKWDTDISFTINIKHLTNKWDINILQCFAFEDADFNARSTHKLQLSDKNGCSTKKNIFGKWTKIEKNSDSTVTYYITIHSKPLNFPTTSRYF